MLDDKIQKQYKFFNKFPENYEKTQHEWNNLPEDAVEKTLQDAENLEEQSSPVCQIVYERTVPEIDKKNSLEN